MYGQTQMIDSNSYYHGQAGIQANRGCFVEGPRFLYRTAGRIRKTQKLRANSFGSVHDIRIELSRTVIDLFVAHKRFGGMISG